MRHCVVRYSEKPLRLKSMIWILYSVGLFEVVSIKRNDIHYIYKGTLCNYFNISYASFQGLDSLVEDFFLDIRVVRVYLQDASADLNTLNEAAGLEEVKSQSITDRY
jgi:hypothetical protein